MCRKLKRRRVHGGPNPTGMYFISSPHMPAVNRVSVMERKYSKKNWLYGEQANLRKKIQ